MQENAPISISNVTTSNITTDSITLNVEATSENTITNYYYAIDDEEFIASNSNTYTFDNLDAGTEYTFRVYAVDDAGYQSAIYSINETTDTMPLFADYIKNTVYTGDGNEGIYYHDGVGTYTNAIEEAGDNSYRYSGVNPDNYVCFASDDVICPNDNLYRIIGVFGDQIKLIKYDYASSAMLGTNGTYNGTVAANGVSTYRGSQSTLYNYYWNQTRNNTWSASGLNTVNLNTNFANYLNGINSKWLNMIETTNWQVGGNTDANIQSVTVKNTYANEIVSPAVNTTYSAKIGLMYASDYGYATTPENWTTVLYEYNNGTAASNNWMYMGYYDWTITRNSYYNFIVFSITTVGNVVYYNTTELLGVRPTFYLKNDVAIVSGDGTSSNPYRLS